MYYYNNYYLIHAKLFKYSSVRFLFAFSSFCACYFALILFLVDSLLFKIFISRKSLTCLGDREVGTENKLLVLACEDGLCVATDVFSRSQVRKAWLE